jgi:hypothetical protein
VIVNRMSLQQIRRSAGEGGNVSYYVDVPTTEGGTRHFAFFGNIFVGPVVVTSRDESGHWEHEVVEEPRRFGEFVTAQWVLEYLDASRLENLPDRGDDVRWFG